MLMAIGHPAAPTLLPIAVGHNEEALYFGLVMAYHELQAFVYPYDIKCTTSYSVPSGEVSWDSLQEYRMRNRRGGRKLLVTFSKQIARKHRPQSHLGQRPKQI